MTFNVDISDLAKRSSNASKKALTEEATKTSVILPFIKALGFDPFNLDEVVPEFIADVGMKKGEKVDFSLKIDGTNTILIEVKPISMALGNAQYNQLYRYFAVTDAKLAILTNGKEVWFFSDIDEPNKMDKKPFFMFDFQSHDQEQVAELARFQKSVFSIEKILEAASALKYTSKAAAYIKRQLIEPDDEFVKVIGRQIHDGSLTKSITEQLKPAIQSALDLIIRDRIQDKLNIAFKPDSPPAEQQSAQSIGASSDGSSEIETTEEEMQAFMIVRAIVARELPIDRVTIRDSKTYCSVFVDDNNRKPLCRFYFNAKSKNVIGVFDKDKTEAKHEIDGLGRIYDHAEALTTTARSYL